jgi:hypothetical protein
MGFFRYVSANTLHKGDDDDDDDDDKERIKETKIQGFMYRDTTNVGHELCDYTGGNWSHRNCNKRFKGKFRSHTRKTFTTDSLQNTAVLGTSHTIRNVLQSET